MHIWTKTDDFVTCLNLDAAKRHRNGRQMTTLVSVDLLPAANPLPLSSGSRKRWPNYRLLRKKNTSPRKTLFKAESLMTTVVVKRMNLMPTTREGKELGQMTARTHRRDQNLT